MYLIYSIILIDLLHLHLFTSLLMSEKNKIKREIDKDLN